MLRFPKSKIKIMCSFSKFYENACKVFCLFQIFSLKTIISLLASLSTPYMKVKVGIYFNFILMLRRGFVSNFNFLAHLLFFGSISYFPHNRDLNLHLFRIFISHKCLFGKSETSHFLNNRYILIVRIINNTCWCPWFHCNESSIDASW